MLLRAVYACIHWAFGLNNMCKWLSVIDYGRKQLLSDGELTIKPGHQRIQLGGCTPYRRERHRSIAAMPADVKIDPTPIFSFGAEAVVKVTNLPENFI